MVLRGSFGTFFGAGKGPPSSGRLEGLSFEQKQTPPSLDKSGPERLVWDIFVAGKGPPQFWARGGLSFRANCVLEHIEWVAGGWSLTFVPNPSDDCEPHGD